MVYLYRYLILGLISLVGAIWIAVFQIPDSNLHIIACDVGQGDAILVVKGSVQVLTDGGPNNKVLDCLGKYLPFWDREIELVILTHPEKDHYFGLIEVFRRYKVNNFLYNQDITGTELVEVLEKEVGRGGINFVHPHEDMTIRVGLISLDMLWPPPAYTDSKSNNLGIVYLLRYGDFEALLTADVENKVSDELSLNSKIRDVDYIKVNHHGSKNGLSEKLIKATVPSGLPRQTVGVISAGKNNPYGHPHDEILQMLNKYQLQILRTDEMGDVEVIVPGRT